MEDKKYYTINILFVDQPLLMLSLKKKKKNQDQKKVWFYFQTFFGKILANKFLNSWLKHNKANLPCCLSVTFKVMWPERQRSFLLFLYASLPLLPLDLYSLHFTKPKFCEVCSCVQKTWRKLKLVSESDCRQPGCLAARTLCVCTRFLWLQQNLPS